MSDTYENYLHALAALDRADDRRSIVAHVYTYIENVNAIAAQLSASEAARERLIAATEQVIDAKNSRIRELEAALRDLLALADISEPLPDLVPGVILRARATLDREGEHG